MSDMKILTLDIETSPNLVYSWGLWNQNILPSMIVEPTYTMSWAAKWVGNDEVFYRAYDDEDFLTLMWSLIDEADAIVHYNGTKFDMKHLNREFVVAGMHQPSDYKNIDLLKTVRQRFKFPSNKLDYVAEQILGEKKLHTGTSLWIACLNDEDWAWDKLKDYNIQDVLLTEKLYLAIRGWIKGHPNHGLYVKDQENPVCRNCGSSHVHSKGGEYSASNVFKYWRYKCVDCGANMRGREAVKGKKNESKQVLV